MRAMVDEQSESWGTRSVACRQTGFIVVVSDAVFQRRSFTFLRCFFSVYSRILLSLFVEMLLLTQFTMCCIYHSSGNNINNNNIYSIYCHNCY